MSKPTDPGEVRPQPLSPTLRTRLDRVAAKLDRLRARGSTAFGAGSHQMKLKRPISAGKLAAFEAARGVTLPPSYRAFVTTIGRSGAGPYYGLWPLKRWGEFIEWIADEVPDDWLARPCPLRPGPNPLPRSDEHEDDTSAEALAPFAGVMSLGTQGCTYMTGLIVTGEARGRVVYLDADRGGPVYVGRDPDFLAWYERWLDEQLAGFSDGWFGYGPAGDEATLLQIIAGSDDPTLRREAIGNLHKPPALTDATWPALADALTDPDPETRAAAIRVFGRARREHAAQLAPALVDPIAEVRAEAWRSVMSLDPEPHAAAAWTALGEDPATEVRFAAFFGLQKAGLLDSRRLEHIVSDPALGRLRMSALRAMAFEPGHGPLLAGLLRDDDADLRREAARALTRLGRAADGLAGIERAAAEQLAREPPGGDDPYTRSALIELVVALDVRDAIPLLLAGAGDGDDFEQLATVGALIRLGEPRVAPVARRLLAIDRTPTAPGRGHTRTIAALVREALAASPDPTLRALGD